MLSFLFIPSPFLSLILRSVRIAEKDTIIHHGGVSSILQQVKILDKLLAV